jgi:hypothetical protein
MMNLWFVLLASLFWLAGCAPQQPPPPLPQPPPTYNLDHFKAYIVQAKTGKIKDVKVSDQFINYPKPASITVKPLEMTYFATAVRKNGSSIKDPMAHYAWYRIKYDTYKELIVTYKNQMTDYNWDTIHLKKLRGILVPTEKIEKGSKFPKNLQHYLCYEVDPYGGTKRDVTLIDPQFKQEGKVTAEGPQYFCTPCSKDDYPIKNPDVHLAVYNITDGPFLHKEKTIRNQFGVQCIEIVTQRWLLVPTTKQGFKVLSTQKPQ